jgi:hypothetical protein
MKERGILFSAPNVRALLDDSKSQTRRVVKATGEHGGWLNFGDKGRAAVFLGPPEQEVWCPYGLVGDRLWVRETWASVAAEDAVKARDLDPKRGVFMYRADKPDETPSGCAGGLGKWRPSIFMPRWASRITLEITEVRVERLQAISASDAWAEGVRCSCMKPVPICAGNVDAYRLLWESINGAGSWALNPWVWVITLRRLKP